MLETSLVLAVVSGWFLTGLSWTVGIVVYPGFSLVGPAQWPEFHAAHSRRIAWAVGPMWLLEAIALILWLCSPPATTMVAWFVAGSGALVTVILTIAIAVPQHQRLATRSDHHRLSSLRRAHHLRSVCWTVSAVASTVALGQVLS